MIRIQVYLFAAVFLVWSFVSNQALANYQYKNTDLNSQVRQELSNLIAYYNIPGAVLAYGFKNEPITTLAVGYSDISKARPMESTSLFHSGSSAKSMTAAVILKLTEEKKLWLDETLSHIASIYHGKLAVILERYPSLAPITLKQLLNHTSGVPQSINTQFFKERFASNPKKYWSEDALIQLAMRQPLYFKPGTKGYWSYTNTDYILLAIVIETVTKKSLVESYQTLWDKADLKNIFYARDGIVPLKARHELALGYVFKNNSSNNASAFKNCVVVKMKSSSTEAYQLPWDAYNSNAPGAGGVILSAKALAKWYRALFEGKVLTKGSIAQMLEGIPNGKFNDAKYGLGVTMHQLHKYGQVVSHDGLTPGYSVNVFYFKKYKLVLGIMTNSSNPYVSTFNVHNGGMIAGIVTSLLPLILQNDS